MYQIEAKPLGNFDVAVCGGGVAGVFAAVIAARQGAKVVLIESAGALGGTMTESFMGNLIDADGRGSLIQEMRDFLEAHDMTCINQGERLDKDGKIITGNLLNEEGVKYFMDKICAEAGVRVLFFSRVCHVDHTDGHINSILVCTECGNYSVNAKIYIDATGNGSVAALTGCKWECGEPESGRPSPVSMEATAVGFPEEFNGTDDEKDKTIYANMLAEHGIQLSAQQGCIKKRPDLKTWGMGMTMGYDVMPDNIESLSNAIYTLRKENFEVIHAHRRIPTFENVRLIATTPHIGVREGRRIFGEYRLNNDDILSGRRFEDAVCLVTFHVDVHKLHAEDTIEQTRGYEMKPFHIPYRCLVPLGSDNLLLAGRCISGDFYPFSAYRVIGNMAGVGEAAGYAAAVCAREGIRPNQVDGKEVSNFMKPYLDEEYINTFHSYY